ncbi:MULTISPECIES: penicillin acylase family protein [unclassified Chitinophaga]|uniref:penicillin acylase family protein n=1 Tax=unclassified Chitinophaga TaxID=2619133 RepID=UPI00300FD7CD
MKRIIGTIIVTIVTIAWVIFISLHFHGLNAMQQALNYNGGIASLEGNRYDSTATLNIPFAGATVSIDSLGIPHIFGKDNNSLAYATGYMHARDRYFQMEILAHSVMGKLSEIIGPDGIPSDRLWKSFEIENKALAVMDSLSVTDPGLVSYLNAYTQGINDYIHAERKDRRDPAYLCWGYSPQPWKAYYTLLIQWYLSFDLSYYDDYVSRQEILDKLPRHIQEILYPQSPDNEPVIIPSVHPAPLSMKQNGPAMPKVFDQASKNTYAARPVYSSLGSNNWVVGPTATANQESFLCNDLHLFLTNPNIFYEVQLHSDSMNIYGFTIPGVPVVLTGHNEKVAWGITNGGWDVTEQYLLRTDPRDASRYWLNGQWEKMTTRKFTIAVKGQQPVIHTVNYTVFGPVSKKGAFTCATRWHPALSNYSIRAFWKMNSATDWNSFRASLREYDYPSQNFAFMDVNGNVGMQCAGRMPVKPAAYEGGMLDGTVSPEYGYLPFDSLPASLNPQQGYLFSANQQPAKDNHYYANRWFDDLYRPKRINELLLAGKGKITREDMRKMQTDVTDLAVNDLRHLLVKYTDTARLGSDWKALLRWNGELLPDKREAVFFRIFRRAVRMNCWDIAGKLGVWASPSMDQFMHFLLLDSTVTHNGKNFSSRIYFHKLMNDADSLYKIAPHDPYTFSIPQMTMLPGFDIPVKDVGGSENTINVNYSAHPVIRTLIQVKDGSIQSWMVNALGQTGRLNDKDYALQLDDWKTNKMHQTQFPHTADQLYGITAVITFKQQP